MQPYSYTTQFANRLPFSQHLVSRYSESPAVPPISQFGGTATIFFVPQTLQQVSATAAEHIVKFDVTLLARQFLPHNNLS